MVKLSIIISYYKALDNLKIILLALNNQTSADFEAIISEDDNNDETIQFLKNNSFNFRIKHINQLKDDGFRKTEMLNKSIKASEGSIIAFIDGDCIPHKKFAEQYIKQAKQGIFLWGRRVMLGEIISNKILITKSLKYLNLIPIIFSDSNKKKEAFYSPHLKLSLKYRGITGCNWGIMKQHLLEINGFDEDYILPTVGEDDDIEWRLLKKGIKPVSIKNKAIVYHIFHPRSYSNQGWIVNSKKLKEKKYKELIECLNGLEKKII